jgi:hypothetical protein
MFDCPMCYVAAHDADRESEERNIEAVYQNFYRMAEQKNWRPISIAFQSKGETLQYLDELEKFIILFKHLKKEREVNTYHHLYTNGVLATPDVLKRLKDWEINEIRFHISASDFDQQVFQHIELAAKMDFVVTVEEPSWPLHKTQLIQSMHVFHNIGVKHFDLIEVQITKYNFNRIRKAYPGVRMFRDYYYHVYDEGLVYDLMKIKVKEGYDFSILDCNSGVERLRWGQFEAVVGYPNLADINGACAPYSFFSG